MSLDVYLYGKPIGTLSPAGEGSYRFAYRQEVVERAAPAETLLSNSLPLRAEPFGHDVSRAYVEGLLPQGARREAIAAELGLASADGYGLIAALGRDCLGAVSFAPAGEDAPPAGGEPAWLSESELEEAVHWSPGRWFDDADPQRMRFALPGERHKLALVHDERDDRWAWPQPGFPSTHIVKPEPLELPGLVANEHACTQAYRELGLPVAHTAVETIGGTSCLVSKRFDRWGPGPRVAALHQESFAQALGIAPDDTEGRLETGAPSLAEARRLLLAIEEPGAIGTLMQATFCDLLLGCTEQRCDNAALLFGRDGQMLAPLYDIASTEIYGQVRAAPIVTGVDVPPAPLLIQLRHTIELCGAKFQPALIAAVGLMGPLVSALGAIAEDAWEEGWHRRAIEEAILTMTARAHGFRAESEYLKPPGERR